MTAADRPFAGRRLCIATMHRKERVLRPLLERELGVVCVLPPVGFDTDRFGSFSGAVPRAGTASAAAEAKAAAGMEAMDTDLAVASEGSFGPHPDAPMLACGMELVLLVDRSLELVVEGRHLSASTNHARTECRRPEDAIELAHRIGFPSHGVLLSVGEPPIRTWGKARSWSTLDRDVAQAIASASNLGLSCYAAADLRAHRNPTRMASIARAADELVANALRHCPGCRMPGFGSKREVLPRPCRTCGESTNVAGDVVYVCLKCSRRERRWSNDVIESADPMSCSFCNP